MNFIIRVMVVGLALMLVGSSAQPDGSSQHGKHPKRAGVKKVPANRQFGPAATLTVTEYRTVVTTITTVSTGLCGKLVNVTGACRRRRGMWEDEPVIMTFDEGLDYVDEILSPTATLQFESTPLVQLNLPDAPIRVKNQPSVAVLQPSTSGEDLNILFSNGPVESRLGFGFLSRFIFDTILRPSSTVTITVTYVDTSTATNTNYVSLTFFIQNCTPSPFPYSQCAARRSGSAQ